MPGLSGKRFIMFGIFDIVAFCVNIANIQESHNRQDFYTLTFAKHHTICYDIYTMKIIKSTPKTLLLFIYSVLLCVAPILTVFGAFNFTHILLLLLSIIFFLLSIFKEKQNKLFGLLAILIIGVHIGTALVRFPICKFTGGLTTDYTGPYFDCDCIGVEKNPILGGRTECIGTRTQCSFVDFGLAHPDGPYTPISCTEVDNFFNIENYEIRQ
jgi:hypothetical protein